MEILFFVFIPRFSVTQGDSAILPFPVLGFTSGLLCGLENIYSSVGSILEAEGKILTLSLQLCSTTPECSFDRTADPSSTDYCMCMSIILCQN